MDALLRTTARIWARDWEKDEIESVRILELRAPKTEAGPRFIAKTLSVVTFRRRYARPRAGCGARSQIQTLLEVQVRTPRRW